MQSLVKEQYEESLASLKHMLNKCFMREDRLADGAVRKTWAVITGYPELESTRTNVSFNPYQLPSIQFSTCKRRCYPFSLSNDHHSDDVFHFEMLFTGDLPSQYKNGANRSALMYDPWVEVTQTEFICAAEERFREFIAKIFEETTPRL